MHIAYFTDSNSFKSDALRDKHVSYQYPGSGWISCLYNIAKNYGVDIASGDVALEHVACGRWSAKDLLIVQDMGCRRACGLLQSGATPFMITCFEAPLYAPFFHDSAHLIAARFKLRCGFGLGETGQNFGGSNISTQFKFPSFYLDDVLPVGSPADWRSRRRLALVAANKFKSTRIFLPTGSGPKDWLRQLKWQYWRAISRAYRNSLNACLHESRLKAIDYFGNNGGIDLYGAGWEAMGGLPLDWAKRLLLNRGITARGACGSKLQTLRDYQYAICYENCAIPGYITEKIIDCFVAGVIPIYLGAPDINQHIPAAAFLAPNELDFSHLLSRMNRLDEYEALSIIERGREYLNSTQGRLHSYEGFANAVLKVALTC